MRYILISLVILFGLGCGCQSGITSRFGGGPIELELPSNCERVVNFSKTKSTKLLSYLDENGVLRVKEYSNMGVLEAEYTFSGATFNKDLTRR